MTIRSRSVLIVLILACLVWGAPIQALDRRAGLSPRDIDWKAYKDMAVDLMQRYLQINTSNPPGNEMATAQFLDRKSVV